MFTATLECPKCSYQSKSFCPWGNIHDGRIDVVYAAGDLGVRVHSFTREDIVAQGVDLDTHEGLDEMIAENARDGESDVSFALGEEHVTDLRCPQCSSNTLELKVGGII